MKTGMSTVLVKLDLSRDWQILTMPPALEERLQDLLDRQDAKGTLTGREKREATALTQLVDILAQMKLGADEAQRAAS